MPEVKYRNKKTRQVYRSVEFNSTPMARVVTDAGSVYVVHRDSIEPVVPDKQVDLFTSETEADRRFREFHEKNPQVYQQLVKHARTAKARGKPKISIELLVNVVRWYTFLHTDDPNSEFKINNNYKSRYARMIMEQEPDLSSIFNLREMKS